MVAVEHGRQRARTVAQLLGRQHVFAPQQVNAAGCGRTALDAVDVDRRAVGLARMSTAIQPRRCAACRSSSAMRWNAGVVPRSRWGCIRSRTDSRRSRSRARLLVARAEGACRRQRSRLRGFGAMAELQQLVRVQRPIDPRQAAQKIGLPVGTGQRFEPGVSACCHHRAGRQRLQPPVPGHLATGGSERAVGFDATDQNDRGRILAGSPAMAGPAAAATTSPTASAAAPPPTGSMTSSVGGSRSDISTIYGRLSGRQAGDLFLTRRNDDDRAELALRGS